MNNQEEVQEKSKSNKNPLLTKISFIVIITVLLLIPTAMIKGIITDRQDNKSEAISEVGRKWGEQQIIVGPILTIPYKKLVRKSNSTFEKMETMEVIEQIHILPEVLSIESDIIPQRLERGIFEVAVYDSQTTFKGSFESFDPNSLNINFDDLLIDQAFVSIGISDMRGIQDQVLLNWNGENETFTTSSGILDKELIYSGINALVELKQSDRKTKETAFSFNLDLKGSSYIYFTPVGKKTEVAISSLWNSPSFKGEFLPTKREVTDDGFNASWNIVDLNRNFPQAWTDSKHNVKAAAFGVDLFIPADNYQKAERSIKYSILFIALTFMVFFFVEIMNKRAVHPIQYILVGLALCLFYTLLLSISEHSPFNLAYIISAGMTLALVTGYSKAILRNTNLMLMLAGVLSVLYSFIFIIIQMEDMALLTGSLGLFFILTLVMYYSRKIDWYTANNAIKA